MYKLKTVYLFTLFVFVSHKINAQTSPNDPVLAIDTSAILQDLKNLLDGKIEPISYASVELGIGNRLFSLRNNRINAKQSITRTIVYTPSINYYHKTGLYVSAGANLLRDSTNNFGANQYSLTGGYSLVGNKHWNVGISFSKYFVKNTYSPYASPIQNDLYLSLGYKKLWLQPSIAFGYSSGKYNQARRKDTTINNIKRLLYDSATFHLKSLSYIISFNHDFDWDDVFTATDGLSLSTTFMLNLGSSTTNITHKTNAVNVLNFLNKRGKLPKLQTTPFQAESIGLNLQLSYSIGNFNITPQCYLDYYLPAADENKFTQTFMINLGYSF